MLAAAALVMAYGAAAPAWAADDGEAPIWQGLSDVVSPYIGVSKDNPTIEYRERSKLVVPPKMELPKPGAGSTSAAFPTDQDIKQARKMKQMEDGPSTLPVGRKSTLVVTGGATITMSATAGTGAGSTCLQNGQAVACPTNDPKQKTTGGGLNWNPLTWVGVEKKPEIVMGPEPSRDFLTDPPPGYRAPVEGVGAKVNDN